MNGPQASKKDTGAQLSISFYNTTCLRGDELKYRRVKADADKRLVLAFFRMHQGEIFTPFEVMEQLGYGYEKLNSIRRAMTDLSQEEIPLLVKTEIMRPGKFGATNHTWMLA